MISIYINTYQCKSMQIITNPKNLKQLHDDPFKSTIDSSLIYQLSYLHGKPEFHIDMNTYYYLLL